MKLSLMDSVEPMDSGSESLPGDGVTHLRLESCFREENRMERSIA